MSGLHWRKRRRVFNGPKRQHRRVETRSSARRKARRQYIQVLQPNKDELIQGLSRSWFSFLMSAITQVARPGLLKLPLEIRNQIYRYLSGSCANLSRPSQEDLYVCLFVNQQLRTEVTKVFYAVPHFRFFFVQQCYFFLWTTRFRLSSITSLNLSVPARDTASLDTIFKNLLVANAPLRYLVIHHLKMPGQYSPMQRPLTAYMLPRRICLSVKGLIEACNPKDTDEPSDRDNHLYATWHLPHHIERARNGSSALSQFNKVRYVAVHGQLIGGLQFELGILKLHLKMLAVAEQECREVILGDGSDSRLDKLWFYSVWIENEVPLVRERV